MGRGMTLLGVPVMGGGTGFTSIFRDTFTTDDDAPVTSPRTAEPGVGVATISDTAAVIDGGKLIFNTFSKLYLTTTTFTRQTGRAFYLVDSPIHDSNSIGGYLAAANQALAANEALGVKADLAIGRDRIVWQGSSGIKVAGVDLSLMPVPDTALSGFTTLQYLLVCRSVGGFAIVGGQAYDGHWYLAWVRNTLSNANLQLAACAHNLMDVFGDIRVGDLSGVWRDDYGIAVHRAATPANPTTATGAADAITEVTWTAGAGETLELSIRRTDDDNRLIVRCIQADNTLNLIQREGGVESSLSSGTVAQTWTASTIYRVVARCQGTRIDVVIDGARLVSATSAFNQTATGVQVSGGAGLADLVAWPVDVTDYIPAALKSLEMRYVLPLGDSKTANANQPRGSYVMELVRLMDAAQTPFYQEKPLRFAQGGATVTYWRANIDTRIAAAVGTPNFILINLGVNDVNGDTADVLRDGTGALWTADMNYVLDALHTAYPQAQIYLMRVGKRGDATVQSKLDFIDDDRIPAFIAERSYCHAGPDERVFLEGGDDYVTYTSDGIHPTTEGYTLTAEQWLAVLTA